MDVVSKLTVKNLTPPGYFNLSPDAKASTVAYTTWWNNILSGWATDSVNLKTFLLTPWLVNFTDSPRIPWLQYLTTMYGLGFFGGTNNQAAKLYQMLSSAWSTSTIYNINYIVQTLCLPPFSWFTFGSTTSPGITAGNLVSDLVDTGFVIYSTAASPPTPAPTVYAPRNWTVPVGWTSAASSAVKYSRGYISGSTLMWCAPRPVSDFSNAYVFSAAVPVSVPSAGTIALVKDDSTGDIASVYYSDGVAWRKSSMPNADLGLVVPLGARPSPEAITVWAPNPSSVTYAIDSSVQPPVSGPTQGYGTFAGWAETETYTETITITMIQIAGGTVAIATLIELLRKVKPVNILFNLDISGVKYPIYDVRQK